MELQGLKWKLDAHLQEYGDDLTEVPIEQLISDATSIQEAIKEHDYLHDHIEQLEEFKFRERIDQDELAEIICEIQRDLK